MTIINFNDEIINEQKEIAQGQLRDCMRPDANKYMKRKTIKAIKEYNYELIDKIIEGNHMREHFNEYVSRRPELFDTYLDDIIDLMHVGDIYYTDYYFMFKENN